jgi:hypothetical protein
MDLLLTQNELPSGFNYPSPLLRLVEHGLRELPPWWLLLDQRLRSSQRGLASRYPARTLVPFAYRQDSDDVAAFDVDLGQVVVIHDYAAPGFEQRSAAVDFTSWLRHAIDDFVNFDE